MKHPFESLSADKLRKIYWVFLLLTAVVAIGLGKLAQYHPAGAPPDAAALTVPTIAFEFARTPEAWNKLAAEAGDAGAEALRMQTYADYLFLLCYSTLLAAAVIGVARGSEHAFVTNSARWLAWGQWFAALMDAVENFGMLQNLAGPVSGAWTQISSTAALIKFAIIGIGILYIYIFLARSWRDSRG